MLHQPHRGSAVETSSLMVTRRAGLRVVDSSQPRTSIFSTRFLSTRTRRRKHITAIHSFLTLAQFGLRVRQAVNRPVVPCIDAALTNPLGFPPAVCRIPCANSNSSGHRRHPSATLTPETRAPELTGAVPSSSAWFYAQVRVTWIGLVETRSDWRLVQREVRLPPPVAVPGRLVP